MNAGQRVDRAVRWTMWAAVVAVAGVAGYVSYWHAVEVVTHHGEPGIIGHLYPILIDGLIVAASMVLLDRARHAEDAPVLAWVLLGSGIAVTATANVVYGLTSGWAGALWAAWPAAAFVGAYELSMMLVRASARRSELGKIFQVPPAVPSDVEAAALASMRATVAAGNPWSVNGLATRFGLSRQVATRVRADVLAEANGQHPHDAGEPLPDQ